MAKQKPRLQRNHIGLESNFVWAIGVVEDRHDPLFLGRCKVRYLGHHPEDKKDVPTKLLPWSYPLQPLDNGSSVVGPKEGDWVVAFFRDGLQMQEPVMMGVVPGIPEIEADPKKGFNDPRPNSVLVGHKVPREPIAFPIMFDDGSGSQKDELPIKTRYPQNDLLAKANYVDNKESTANRFERNEFIKDTIVEAKKEWVEIGQTDVPTAFPGYVFTEPKTSYKVKYPYNHCFRSESGHLVEIDDTPKRERLHEYHRAGTYKEIHADGTKVSHIAMNEYHIVRKKLFTHVEHSDHTTIDKMSSLFVNKDREGGNHRNILIGAGGDLNITLEDGNINIVCKKLNIHADTYIEPKLSVPEFRAHNIRTNTFSSLLSFVDTQKSNLIEVVKLRSEVTITKVPPIVAIPVPPIYPDYPTNTHVKKEILDLPDPIPDPSPEEDVLPLETMPISKTSHPIVVKYPKPKPIKYVAGEDPSVMSIGTEQQLSNNIQSSELPISENFPTIDPKKPDFTPRYKTNKLNNLTLELYRQYKNILSLGNNNVTETSYDQFNLTFNNINNYLQQNLNTVSLNQVTDLMNVLINIKNNSEKINFISIEKSFVSLNEQLIKSNNIILNQQQDKNNSSTNNNIPIYSNYETSLGQNLDTLSKNINYCLDNKQNNVSENVLQIIESLNKINTSFSELDIDISLTTVVDLTKISYLNNMISDLKYKVIPTITSLILDRDPIIIKNLNDSINTTEYFQKKISNKLQQSISVPLAPKETIIYKDQLNQIITNINFNNKYVEEFILNINIQTDLNCNIENSSLLYSYEAFINQNIILVNNINTVLEKYSQIKLVNKKSIITTINSILSIVEKEYEIITLKIAQKNLTDINLKLKKLILLFSTAIEQLS